MNRIELDELRLLIVVDNETDTLSSVDDGVPQVPELARHLGYAPVSRTTPDGHECRGGFEHLCVACHGFSALVTGRRGDDEHTVLYDVGPSAQVWLDNAVRLRVDLAKIDALFLSHWHFDHSGALPQVVAAVASARRRAGMAAPLVDLHPDRPDQRGILLPTGTMVLLPPEPTFDAIERAGGRVVRHGEAHALFDGLFWGSGAIPRVTDYETGLVGHHTFRGEECESDPLILDERYLAAAVRGRGITVLSACSHAGVVNAALDAQQVFSGGPIDLLLGGYHLSGKSMEARIVPTLRDLKERIRPQIVAPGHCTGWRAKSALAGCFAPGHYGPSVVGSTYLLKAG